MSIHKRLPLKDLELLSALKSRELFPQHRALPYPMSAKPTVEDRHENSVKHNFSNETEVSPKKGLESATPKNHHDPTTVDNPTARETAVLSILAQSECGVMSRQEVLQALKIASGSISDNIQRRLASPGLIRVIRVQRGKGFVSLWELLSKGYSAIRLPVKPHHSIGSPEHAYHVANIEKSCRADGFHTSIEYNAANGHLIDLVARREGELRCYEVGLPPLNKEVSNCLRIWLSQLNPTQVYHVVRDGRDKKLLTQLLGNDPALDRYRDKIEIKLAGDYITL